MRVTPFQTLVSSFNFIIDIDECRTSPCQNGASCVDELGGYTCQCTEQWLGDNCTGILTLDG